MCKKLRLIVFLFIFGTTTGCALLVGAGAAGGAYEYHNKQQMDELENAFSEGRISREEYLNRKKQINEGSVIY